MEYVFIFENKGKEIGVTLSHPHGQIYAYPYLPEIPKTELESERRHFHETGRPLMEAWLAMELGGAYERAHFRQRAEAATNPGPGRFSPEETPETPEIAKRVAAIDAKAIAPRLVWENELFAALVPFFARYPYEVHVAPKAHLRSLADMGAEALDQLAEILLVVTRKYDKLFGFSMPYIMAMHQEPAAPGFEYAWFHVEFYPPYRTEKKLKYLAGSEAGAGAFINDTLPEETAERLRNLDVGSVR